MTRRFLMLAITLVAIAAPDLLRAYDFKGIEIGKPANIPVINETISAPCELGANRMLVCNGRTTAGGAFARANIVIASDHTIQRIRLTFDSSSFERVERAVLEKFGEPKVTENPPVSNRMGATSIQIKHTWRDEDGNVVILEKYAGSLDDSSLYFASPAEFKMFEEHAKEDSEDL